MFGLSFNAARFSSFLLLLAGVLWGTGGLAGVFLQILGGLSPVPVAAYRLLAGGGLATVVVTLAGQLRFLRGRVAVRRLLISGALLAQFQAAYQVAVDYIDVSLSTLITIGCVPVIVVCVHGTRQRRLPRARTLVAVGVSVVGLGLLTGGPVDGSGWDFAVGVVMSLLAGGGFAALTMISARPVPGQHAITSVGLLVGGLLLVPFALVGGGMSLPLRLDVVLLVGYLGVVPTALAYGAYFLGLRHAHPTAAALASMLEPLTATLLAVGLNGERLSATGVLGALLIAGALGVFYLRR